MDNITKFNVSKTSTVFSYINDCLLIKLHAEFLIGRILNPIFKPILGLLRCQKESLLVEHTAERITKLFILVGLYYAKRLTPVNATE